MSTPMITDRLATWLTTPAATSTSPRAASGNPTTAMPTPITEPDRWEKLSKVYQALIQRRCSHPGCDAVATHLGVWPTRSKAFCRSHKRDHDRRTTGPKNR
jgi:hypothetical protein